MAPTTFQLPLQQLMPITLPPRVLKNTTSKRNEAPPTSVFTVGPGFMKSGIPLRRSEGPMVNSKRSMGTFTTTPESFSSAIRPNGIANHTKAPVPPLGADELVDFNAFSDSPSFQVLSQDLNACVEERKDPRHVRAFRRWMDNKFPHVVHTLTALKLLHEPSEELLQLQRQKQQQRQKQRQLEQERRRKRRHLSATTASNSILKALPEEEIDDDQDSNEGKPHPILEKLQVQILEEDDAYDEFDDLDFGDDGDADDDEDEEEDSEDEEHDEEELMRKKQAIERRKARAVLRRRHAAHTQAWSVLFKHARIVTIAPNEQIMIQDTTVTGSVYFLLNGSCEMLFQPTFLSTVLVQRQRSQTIVFNTAKDQLIRQPTEVVPTNRPPPLKRKLSFSNLTDHDVQKVTTTQVHVRTLRAGDYFGLESAVFQFPRQLVTIVSNGAYERNTIGITKQASMHLLVLPFTAVMSARQLIATSLTDSKTKTPTATLTPPSSSSLINRSLRNSQRFIQTPPVQREEETPVIPRTFPFVFESAHVEFLRQTFLFQSVKQKNLQFLASQMRPLKIPKHEYLFTTGQDVQIYLIKSGQLKVFAPEQVRINLSAISHEQEEDFATAARDLGLETSSSEESSYTPMTTVETRHVELEILQPHDLVGLMEACLTQSTFTRFCIATSNDVEVLCCSAFALFAVLAHEPTATQIAMEHVKRHHAWYKLRRLTALNHHNTQKEFKLSLSAQRKSPIQCSRCGWTGHVSTSSICVRAESPKLAFIKHMSQETSSSPSSPSSPRAGRRISSFQRLSLTLQSPTRTASMATSATDGFVPRGLMSSAALAAALAIQQQHQDPSIKRKTEADDELQPPSSRESITPESRSMRHRSTAILTASAASLIGHWQQENREEEVAVDTGVSNLERALHRLDFALQQIDDSGAQSSSVPRERSPLRESLSVISTDGSDDSQPVTTLKDAAMKAVWRISAANVLAPRGRHGSQSSPPQPLLKRKMAILQS